MANINTLTVAGTVGQDARVFSYGEGKQGISFSLANNGYSNGKETTQWFEVTMFRGAERLSNLVKKGTKVVVVGRVEMQEYQTKEGATKNKLVVFGNDLEIMPKSEAVQQTFVPVEQPTQVVNSDPYDFSASF